MIRSAYDVVIVGSGFAGLAAADLLGDRTLRVLLLDENRHLGGQLLRRMAPRGSELERPEPDRLKRFGFDPTNVLRHKSVHIMNRTQVLGITPGRVLCLEDRRGGVMEVRTEYIVLATGAREKFQPFMGWTLPGVMSTGAAQILMKSSGILPARETLIGGSGPLLQVLASEIRTNGGRVLAVLDEALFRDQLRFLGLWRHQSRKMFEGALNLARLLWAAIPVRSRTRIVEARGKTELEEVLTIRLDRQGGEIQGTEARMKTECLAVGYGFTPNLELPQLAGCDLEYRAERGGWIVSVDDHFETSVGNVYAAGEVTGIAGARKSFIEGQMAALAILRKGGRIDEHRIIRKWATLQEERQHQQQFGKFVNLLCRIRPESYAAIPDETLICRCEDVTMGEIRRQIRDGFSTPGALKKATRCGMGYCQGRTCGPMLGDILAAYGGKPHPELPPLSVRMPVKPVRLEALAMLNAESLPNEQTAAGGQ